MSYDMSKFNGTWERNPDVVGNDKVQLYGKWDEQEARDFIKQQGQNPDDFNFTKGSVDSYFTRKSSGGSGGEGGSSAAAITGSGVSADSIEQFLLSNPRIAEQMWQLTSQYQPKYAELARQSMSADRTSDMGDLARLLPEVRAADLANMRPEERQLRDLLFSQITGELGQGTALTAEQSRDVEQGLRSAENARGVMAGQGSANRESVRKALEGMNLLNTRQEKAKSLIGLESATKTDPYMAILGRPAASTNLAAQQTASGSNQLTPGFFAANEFNAQSSQLNRDSFDRTNAWRDQMMDMMKMNPALAGITI